MIPRQHLWQSHSGAAHRKKIDTPSLGWACFEQIRLAAVNVLRCSEIASSRSPL